MNLVVASRAFSQLRLLQVSARTPGFSHGRRKGLMIENFPLYGACGHSNVVVRLTLVGIRVDLLLNVVITLAFHRATRLLRFSRIDFLQLVRLV